MISSNEGGVGGDGPTNENTGVIAAITISSIAALCLLLLGVLLVRHLKLFIVRLQQLIFVAGAASSSGTK